MLKQNIKQYIEYIRLLRRHQKLSAKRHPAFEQNKTAKFFIYLSAGITIIYLMFFAVIFLQQSIDLFVDIFRLSCDIAADLIRQFFVIADSEPRFPFI